MKTKISMGLSDPQIVFMTPRLKELTGALNSS